MKYIVTKYEVWEQPYEYEADSPEDAMRQAKDPNGDALALDMFEYSRTLPPATWKVEKA
jgi:hypothetical protein